MTSGTGVCRRAHVDLSAIVANATGVSAALTDSTADLRADAYGHGLIAVARALSEAGIGGLLVSRPDDATALADAGITTPTTIGLTAAEPSTQLLGPEIFGLDAERDTAPALRLEGEVVAVKRVGAQRGVSYGYTYRTARPTTLVLVALGYADGILRAASNTAPVLAAGRLGRVSGRIAMDQFVVDIGDGDAQPGAPVILFGDARLGEPTVLEWADALGVSAPAITSRLGRRIERCYTP